MPVCPDTYAIEIASSERVLAYHGEREQLVHPIGDARAAAGDEQRERGGEGGPGDGLGHACDQAGQHLAGLGRVGDHGRVGEEQVGRGGQVPAPRAQRLLRHALHGDHLQVQVQVPAAAAAAVANVLVPPPSQVDVDLRDEEGLGHQERPARDHARRARDEALHPSILAAVSAASLTKWALGLMNADVSSVQEMFPDRLEVQNQSSARIGRIERVDSIVVPTTKTEQHANDWMLITWAEKFSWFGHMHLCSAKVLCMVE